MIATAIVSGPYSPTIVRYIHRLFFFFSGGFVNFKARQLLIGLFVWFSESEILLLSKVKKNPEIKTKKALKIIVDSFLSYHPVFLRPHPPHRYIYIFFGLSVCPFVCPLSVCLSAKLLHWP